VGQILFLAGRPREPTQADKPADGTRATTGPKDGEISAEDEWTVRASVTALRDMPTTVCALLGSTSLSRDSERIGGCPSLPVRY